MTSVRWILRRAASIRVRLTLWYVALLALILIIFSGVLYLTLSRSLREEVDVTLRAEGARLTSTMDFENGAPQMGEGPDNLRIGTVAALYDATGRHLLAYDPRQPLPVTKSLVPSILTATSLHSEASKRLAQSCAPFFGL